MKKISINSLGSIHFKNQKFVEKSKAKSLAVTYIELPKEKKIFYFRHYKKLVKIKLRQNQTFSKHTSKFLLNNKLQKLNNNLSTRKPNNLTFVNSTFPYRNLKQIQLRVRKLKGYSEYYDKIFRF